jgi:phosphoribosylformimino-5-aminoimidazole carboxamide ribotide isomerase
VKIFPAIDILEGKAVRLRKGKRDDVTVFADDPTELVAQFVDAGAERIHVVDLDGAFSGERTHASIIERIAAKAGVPIEVGGGIRDQAALDALFEIGAQYAVLGTAAVKSPEFVEAACKRFPGRIIVAVDAVAGMVAVEGWVEASDVSATELGGRAADWGAAALLYTDISRDGTGAGPNVAATAALARAVEGRADVIASGGVHSLDHIRALAAENIPAVVVGRALYDKQFTLREAIEAAC